MEKNKSHAKNMQKELDTIQSRLDALEASSTEKYDKSMISVLKVLLDNQRHIIEEFEHLKKAIDLLTLQIFKVQNSQKP